MYSLFLIMKYKSKKPECHQNNTQISARDFFKILHNIMRPNCEDCEEIMSRYLNIVWMTLRFL